MLRRFFLWRSHKGPFPSSRHYFFGKARPNCRTEIVSPFKLITAHQWSHLRGSSEKWPWKVITKTLVESQEEIGTVDPLWVFEGRGANRMNISVSDAVKLIRFSERANDSAISHIGPELANTRWYGNLRQKWSSFNEISTNSIELVQNPTSYHLCCH